MDCGDAGFENSHGYEDVLVENCISWDHVGGFVGFDADEVSNGWGQGPAGFDITASDPQFVDGANGDLRLSPTSPCIASANALSPFQPLVDLDENPRWSDGLLSGLAMPDVGAYEHVAYTFEVLGDPRAFDTLELRVSGPNDGLNLWFLLAGDLGGSDDLGQLGTVTIGAGYTVGWHIVPLGGFGGWGAIDVQYPVTVPNLIGNTIGLQAAAADFQPVFPIGNLTNRSRLTIRP